MKLTFIGAAHEVTGSCHFLEACGKKILVDCGMEQGPDLYENQEIPVPPGELDFVLLTHAHIDHSGLLPLIYGGGFKGEVYTTDPTADLCQIMLRDSAHIQEFEAEWRNRKARRAGQEPYEPLYTTEQAIGVLKLFRPCNYGKTYELAPGLRIRFTDVGHLLGSASIEVWVDEDGVKKKLLFSGDVGNLNQPIIKDPTYIEEADYVVIESTYGNRSHGEVPDYTAAFTQIVQETFDRGGNVVIPSFAVGRTQELLYFLRQMKEERLIQGHEGFEVYVDSPLAIEATNIFKENMNSCFDKEAMELVKKGINPLVFDGLKTTVTSDESRAINFNNSPKIIISASGMCEAGRIRHHLKHNLWRKECTILFVGYQAYGTLGRALLEGASTVKLFGETIEVAARIEQLKGISGHADREGLLRYIGALRNKPEQIFVVHGEDMVCDEFAETITNEFGYPALAPYSGGSYDLKENVCLAVGNRERKKRAEDKPAARHASDVFARLVAAGKRLMTVILHNEGGANKDLTKFTNQILALCEKWDR